MGEGDCVRDCGAISDHLGRPGRTLHKIRSPAIRAGTKEGSHDDHSVCRGIGDFGLPLYHRLGRFYGPEKSSLTGATTHTPRALRRYRLAVLRERCRLSGPEVPTYTPAGTGWDRGAKMSMAPRIGSNLPQKERLAYGMERQGKRDFAA